MKEIWRDIKDFEGYYQVSNLGRVKSLDRWRDNRNGGYVQKGNFLKPNIRSKKKSVIE